MNQRYEKSYNMESNINQASQNLCMEINDVNSQSRFNNILRQQSINIPACLSVENGRYLIQDNIQNFDGTNSINFWQAARLTTFSTNSINNAIQEENEKDAQNFEGIDPQKKKGLKFLSWLLNRLLRKKKFDSNQLVNMCIKYVLSKPSQNSNYQQQAQNIRRRIYDSINVMTAIGLVVKNNTFQIFIRKPEPANPLCYGQIRQQLQSQLQGYDNLGQKYENKIQSLTDRIRQKKIYYQILKAQRNKLKKLIQRNKIQQQQINEQSKASLQIGKNCYQFPLIFICSNIKQEVKIQIPNKKQVSIKHRKNNLIVMGELQALLSLKQQKKSNSQEEDEFDLNYFWSEEKKTVKQSKAKIQTRKLKNIIILNQQKSNKKKMRNQQKTKQKSVVKIFEQQQQEENSWSSQ